MPEGDTVYRTAKRLTAALAGKQLVKSDFRVPQLATLQLGGALIGPTRSRGKHLLTAIGDVTLHTHLKMEGRWEVVARGQRWPGPGHAARVVLITDEHSAVGFWLGTVAVFPSGATPTAVSALGPDLLGTDWDAAEAVARLSDQPSRGVYDALLDQTNLAGIGNIYANELCFLAGVLPTRPVADVELSPLVNRAHQLLVVNAERKVRSTTGDLRRGNQLWVYRRAGLPCRRCGQPILSAPIASAPMASAPIASGSTSSGSVDRTAYWCGHCQR